MVSDFSNIFSQFGAESIAQDESNREKFLRFVLLPDTQLMMPLRQISAVLKIPVGEIVPIPEMPAWVMGVYNWRGEILWMIDLGHLVGLAHWHQQAVNSSKHQVIVIHPSNQKKAAQTSGEMIGLVVSQVEDLELCNFNELQSPPSSSVSEELAPFLRGYWVKEEGDILATLDGDAILAAMPKE